MGSAGQREFLIGPSTALHVLDNYTFDGRVYPDDNNDYQFTVDARR